MKVIGRLIFVILASVLGVCHSVNSQLVLTARLQAPDQAAWQELSRATAKLLGVSSVELAENTLRDSSQFSYARKPRYDAAGQKLQGRVIEQPHIFQLQIRGQQCWLVDQKNAQEIWLKHARCVPE
jgi:hypothetical protein